MNRKSKQTTIKHKLQLYADIRAYTDGFEVVSSSIGLDDSLYILLIDRAPEREQGMFVPSRTTYGHTYKVLTLDGDHMEELLLSGQKFNYHFVQPSVEFANPHISGASGFIKQGQAFLFDKGYGKHEQYILTRLKPERGFKEQYTVRFVNEAGEAIKAVDRDFRGDTLLLREDHLIYKLRLYDIAEARYD
ncbi:hypothetical protein [Paenibacillus sp. 8b26]|uniref:hypothetical protein n=1 Tax=Paenibacillus sp. 8b26 TaxID=3424133 RepID=UPI003D649B95